MPRWLYSCKGIPSDYSSYNTQPVFLEAVEVYARKYGVDGITNYYMARNQGNYAEFEEVTDDIDKIYQEMSEPFEHLDDLRLEMEMDKQ